MDLGSSCNAASVSYPGVRKLNVVSCCLVASAFGPYLLPEFGLRLDHMVVFSLFLMLFCAAALSASPVSLNSMLLVIILSLTAAIIWTVVATVFGEYQVISGNLALASFVRFSLPIALIGIIALATRGIPKTELCNCLRIVCLAICIFLTLNAMLAASQKFLDTSPLVHYFLRSRPGHTVWENAVVQGRYTGIFDQPLESGLAYTIGLLSWIYFTHTTRSMWPWLLLPLLILGGILSGSKIFLLAGMPGAILYLLSLERSRSGTYCQVFLGLIGAAVAVELLLDQWTGISFITNLADPTYLEEDPVGLLTAGRFGSEGWVWSQFVQVWQSDPLSGRGFGTLQPFDNAYLEFFWQGGMVALIIYGIILATIAWTGIRGILENEEHGFLIAILCIMIIGVGFGSPVLTLNRSSILLWVVMSLAIVIVTSADSETYEAS